jgi:hypothetical protein
MMAFSTGVIQILPFCVFIFENLVHTSSTIALLLSLFIHTYDYNVCAAYTYHLVTLIVWITLHKHMYNLWPCFEILGQFHTRITHCFALLHNILYCESHTVSQKTLGIHTIYCIVGTFCCSQLPWQIDSCMLWWLFAEPIYIM